MNLEEFYAEVASILGTTHDYVDLAPRKKFGRDFEEYMPDTRYTRWGPRIAGNGRFEGYGLVRVIGDGVQVCLRNPVVLNGFYQSMEDALAALREAIGDQE